MDIRREVVKPIGEDSFIVVYRASAPQAPPVPLSLWQKGSDGTYFAEAQESGPRDWAKLKQIIRNSKPVAGPFA